MERTNKAKEAEEAEGKQLMQTSNIGQKVTLVWWKNCLEQLRVEPRRLEKENKHEPMFFWIL